MTVGIHPVLASEQPVVRRSATPPSPAPRNACGTILSRSALPKRPRKPRSEGGAGLARPLLPLGPSRPAFPRYRFSGHQSFPFRHGWLAKAARGIAEDPDLFAREDALARLGVGKNMVASMRHWCEATGVMEFGARSRSARMTDLGELLIGHPSYPPPPPKIRAR